MFVLCRCAKRELMKLVAFGSKRRSDFAQSLCLHVRVTNLTAGLTGWWESAVEAWRTGVRDARKQRCGFRSLRRVTENRKMFVLNLLGHFVLDDCELAAIVAASGANRVVDVESTAVGALGERGSYGLVMGATLEGAGLGLSSFRMCHGVICLFVCFVGICGARAARLRSCQPRSPLGMVN